MSGNSVAMTFHSGAVADATLQISGATGTEALSSPFRFDIDLISSNPGLDLVALLSNKARVSMNRTMVFGDGRTGTLVYDYHGMITEIRQNGRAGMNRYRYKAVLRPDLWKLACTRRSRIFVDKNVPDLIRTVFNEAKIAFKLKIAKESSYPIYRYAVQYEETDLDFISRWMEQVGICYYYDIEGDHGSVVVIDNPRGYAPISPYGEKVPFDDKSRAGLASTDGHQRISRLDAEEIQIPKTVQLKDHNSESPDEALFFEAEVDPKGVGIWYEYNSNYRTESEGRFLLGIRRDYWRGRRLRFNGEGDHRSFQPGRTFTPSNHFNPGIVDRSYVLLDVQHHVSQENDGEVSASGDYTCAFTAMPAELPFRPERVTTWPSIHGVVQARVVGGALAYAELDDMGRYKIESDYDQTKQTIGKVRMAQPSVGEEAGFNFPLRKDTEVLLGHIDGDPDRPVIMGAVHDGKKINLLDKLRDPLGTVNSLRSQGGNLLLMADDPTNKFITMMNGSFNTIQQFGRPEHSDPTTGGSSTHSAVGQMPSWAKPKARPTDESRPTRPPGINDSPLSPASPPPPPASPSAQAPDASGPAPQPSPAPQHDSAESRKSNAKPSRFKDSSAGFPAFSSDGDTSGEADVRDTPVARFWAAVSGMYDDCGQTAQTTTNLTTNPDGTTTPSLTPPQDWKTIAYEEFKAIWTIPAPVAATAPINPLNPPAPGQWPDFDTETLLPPPSPMGAAKMNNQSLGPTPPDPSAPWITELVYPGLNSGFWQSDSDWGANFANFIATSGGTMKFALGEDIEISHGNKYRYLRGTLCNWQIGDLHNVGVNGNTYNYNWGSSEVSFNMGPSTVCTYNNQTSSEWAYSTGTANFEMINGDKTEISSAQNTTTTETVTGTATSTSNVGGKGRDGGSGRRDASRGWRTAIRNEPQWPEIDHSRLGGSDVLAVRQIRGDLGGER
jgi:type VI secretion system secreted protein VgrG